MFLMYFLVCAICFSSSFSLPLTPEELQKIAATHETRREYVLKKLLPNLSFCGFQHSDDHFNYGSDTALDEFPWLVHIPYQSTYLHPTKDYEFKCAGVLLSNKFVLTTSLCASDGFLSSVKLGQYNKLKNSTCQHNDQWEECTDPAIEIETRAKADIPNTGFLLLKLYTPITYSDYIRPICLPVTDDHSAKPGETVITTGWGEEDYKGSTVMVKKRIKHTVLNDTVCNGDGSKNKLCFLPESDTQYVCVGDQGGPVIYSHQSQWFLNGLVHFETSTERCVKSGVAIAKKITSEVIEGILDFMFYLGHD